MSRVVPRGPCTGDLDWNLHVAPDGETFVPFHIHVQRDSTHQLPTQHIPQFSQLPTEIQLQILRHCSSAVLFQLMHVSSAMRREAEKLFWSSPDLWWQIDGDWLLAGGFSGHTHYAIESLAKMTKMEVEFGCLGSFGHNIWEDGERQYAKIPPSHVRNQQIYDFWQTLQRRFPSAKNVVLSECGKSEAGLLPPAGLRIMAEKCPTHIFTSVSCLQQVAGHPQRKTRSSWRPVYTRGIPSGTLDLVTLDWTRESVHPPDKKFSGAVGAFCRIGRDNYRNFCMRSAVRVLYILAIEGYYQQDGPRPCVCPFPGCGLQFALPGQWATHAIDATHDQGIDLPSEKLQSSFKNHIAQLARMEQECTDAMESLRRDWGEEGSEQRTDAEYAFLSQLQHDPLYTHEYPSRESPIWRRYQIRMNNEFSWR